ncbi:MAG: phage holin family protein [Actinomycetales bacterium]
MRSFAIKVVVNAVAIWIATLVTGISVSGGSNTTSGKVLTFLFIGLLFGIVNAVVKPVVKVLAFPFYIVTLGLLTFVVNALMLELTSWLSRHTDLQLHIDHFWWQAVGAALVVSFISLVLNLILPDSLREDRLKQRS